MGREDLIKAIMASDGVDYATASQKVQEIYNSPDGQSQVDSYQSFAQYNPDLLQSVDTNYTSPQPTFDSQSMFGQTDIGNNPFQVGMLSSQRPEVGGAGFQLQEINNPLNLTGQGTIGTNPLQESMLMQDRDVSTPENEQLYEGFAKGPDETKEKQNKVSYDSFNPFMYPGGLSAGYQAYTAGNLLSRENKTAGDWIGGLSAAAGGALNIGRSVMSGIANTKQSDKARDWWMEQEMKRQYTPNRTYGDQNNRGGVTTNKYGGTINIKRNGN